jgi:hypothetical protein
MVQANSINSMFTSDRLRLTDWFHSPLNRTVYRPATAWPVGSYENFGAVS